MEPPSSYSPSSLSQFTTCPLAYRYIYIDKLPQPPQLAATKGSIVHRALELLFLRESNERTIQNATTDLDLAFKEYESSEELIGLNLDASQHEKLYADANSLLAKYFQLEDPKLISPIGLEIKLEAKVNGITLRGIIDRLELDTDGELVVVDYKTGSAPPKNSEQSRLAGVHFYALLCNEIFGRIPSKIKLLYLSKPLAIIAEPNELSLKGIENKSKAIHNAVESACLKNDFRPKESALCNWCSFQDLCPAKGGQILDVAKS